MLPANKPGWRASAVREVKKAAALPPAPGTKRGTPAAGGDVDVDVDVDVIPLNDGLEGHFVYDYPVELQFLEQACPQFTIKNTVDKSVAFASFSADSVSKDTTWSELGYWLIDSAGNAVYNRRRKHRHVLDAKLKQPVLTMRATGVFVQEMLFWKGSEEVGEPWMKAVGDFGAMKYAFVEVSSGERLATVDVKVVAVERDGFWESLIAGNSARLEDWIVLKVQPGNDVALFAFLVVTLFEYFKDPKP